MGKYVEIDGKDVWVERRVASISVDDSGLDEQREELLEYYPDFEEVFCFYWTTGDDEYYSNMYDIEELYDYFDEMQEYFKPEDKIDWDWEGAWINIKTDDGEHQITLCHIEQEDEIFEDEDEYDEDEDEEDDEYEDDDDTW